MPERSSAFDGSLPIEPPLAIESPGALEWAERCDVLVVGFGAAGAAAAIKAAEAGAKVTLVDRFEGGGATAISGGVVYAGGGTRHQLKAGYQDTPDAMFRYLRQETGDAISEVTLRRFCEDSRGLIEWLESLGANFDSSRPPPKTSYPPDGVLLYYSGNESVPSYAKHAKPAPRGHRAPGSWLTAGRTLFGFLRHRVEALNIPVMTQGAVRRLITDKTGAVLGAEVWRLAPASEAALTHQKLIQRAEKFHNVAQHYSDRLRLHALDLELREARPSRVRATRGVILSTGGFIFNRRMVAEYAPKYLENMRLGTTGCDGSGIRLGQSVGAATGRLDKVSAWRFINPPTAWPKGIAINSEGRRFCNEQVYGARLGVEMCEHHGGHAWLILDSALRRTAMLEALFGGLWFFQGLPAYLQMLFARRASSVAALAGKIGVPATAFQATVDRYNASAQGSGEDEVGKSPDMRQPLATAPFYALNISVSTANKLLPCPSITLGGLRVDETSGAVLDGSGRIIPGLYAAGRAAVGIASNGYVSGLSIADCLWSGLRAGAQAAARAETGMATRNIA